MLEMSRGRLHTYPNTAFLQGSFKEPGWRSQLEGHFDAVIAQQSLHEIRHKRHLPGLYLEILQLLKPGGIFLVSDHNPISESEKALALFATSDEQMEFMLQAGFENVVLEGTVDGLYVVSAWKR